MICPENFLYIKKNYAMSGRIFVCPEKNLRLPPPRSPTFLGKEILISGCSHSAKFTLTPPPPIQRGVARLATPLSVVHRITIFQAS